MEAGNRPTQFTEFYHLFGFAGLARRLRAYLPFPFFVNKNKKERER